MEVQTLTLSKHSLNVELAISSFQSNQMKQCFGITILIICFIEYVFNVNLW